MLLERSQGSGENRSRFEEGALSDLENDDPIFVSVNTRYSSGTTVDLVHQVVLYGVDLDENGKPLLFYYLDPSWTVQNPEHEGRKSVSSDELWTMMIDNPEPGYVW